MLERATICPKYGARHARLLSQNLTRSRRSLHSAFWAHGAGDINLPWWWLEFLQRTSNERPLFFQRIAKTAKRYIPSILKSSLALDFLYPPKALSLARTLLAEHASASLQPSYNHRKVGHGARHFADLAADKIVNEEERPEEVETPTAVRENQTEVDQSATTPTEGYEVRKGSWVDLEDSSTQEEGLGSDFLRLVQRLTWYRRLWDQLQVLPEYTADVDTLDLERVNVLWDHLEEVSSHATDLALEYAQFVRTKVLPSNTETWTPLNFARIVKACYLSSPPKTSIWVGDNVMARLMVSKFFKKALDQGKENASLQTILDLTLSFSDWALADTALRDFQSCRDISDFWASLSSFDTELLGERIIMMSKTYAMPVAQQSVVDSPFLANYSTISTRLISHAFREFFNRPITPDFDPIMLWQIWNALSKTELQKDVYFASAVKQLLGPSKSLSKTSLLTIQAYRAWEESRSALDFTHDYDIVVQLFRRLRHLHHPGARVVWEDLRQRFGPPSPSVYRAMLRELSYHGEAEKYSETLKDFIEHCTTGPLQPLLADLIRAYAQRGDSIGAERVFDSITLEHGLEPDQSCWNAVLGAHARLSGASEVLKWISKMEDHGVQPIAETYRIILRSFCNRGEMDSALALLDHIEKSGFPLDSHMVTSLVFGHTQNGDLDAAEKLVLDAVTNKLPGEMTRMWNIILYAYAILGHMDEVQHLHERMLQEGIPEDADTHTAILQVTSFTKFPNLGLKIIREIMIPKGLLPSSFHFSIIIAGFIRTKEYARAFQAARGMKELGVEPDVGTKMLLIRAAVGQSIEDTERDEEGKTMLEKVDLDAAEKLLDYLLSTESLADLARHHPIFGRAQQSYHEVYAANYFETLILVYSRANALDKVSQFFDRWQALYASRFPNHPLDPPIRILNALMIAHEQANDHAAIESCWTTAYAKAAPLARRSNADTSQPNWVLPSRRFLLHLPFYNYMRSLVKSGRSADLTPLINSYQSAGYALDSKAWNLYVRTLVLDGHVETAFSLAEEMLIDGFVGWPSWAGHRSPGSWLRKISPTNRDLRVFAPHYKTLVVLARGYMDFRGQLAFSGDKEEKLQGLAEAAPRVVEAVMYMPRVDDWTQLKYLRGR